MKYYNPFLRSAKSAPYYLLKDCLLNIALSSACNKSDALDIRANKVKTTLKRELNRLMINFKNREILVLITELSKLLSASDEDVVRISLTLTDNLK